jgi:hypothetical protein
VVERGIVHFSSPDSNPAFTGLSRLSPQNGTFFKSNRAFERLSISICRAKFGAPGDDSIEKSANLTTPLKFLE